MKSIKHLFPLAALALCGVAAAATHSENSVVVRYDDLNLNSQTGVASLHKRIYNAARTVCRPLETRILSLHEAYDQCVDDAIASGVVSVGNPNLTNFHARKAKSQVLASNR